MESYGSRFAKWKKEIKIRRYNTKNVIRIFHNNNKFIAACDAYAEK